MLSSGHFMLKFLAEILVPVAILVNFSFCNGICLIPFCLCIQSILVQRYQLFRLRQVTSLLNCNAWPGHSISNLDTFHELQSPS